MRTVELLEARRAQLNGQPIQPTRPGRHRAITTPPIAAHPIQLALLVRAVGIGLVLFAIARKTSK